MSWFLQGTRIYNFFHADLFAKLNIPLDRAYLAGELSMSRTSQSHRLGCDIYILKTWKPEISLFPLILLTSVHIDYVFTLLWPSIGSQVLQIALAHRSFEFIPWSWTPRLQWLDFYSD